MSRYGYSNNSNNSNNTTSNINSHLIDYIKLSPNHSGLRTHAVDRITPHCVVGQFSVEDIANFFLPRARQASSNYGIGKDGRVGMYVEEQNRSWCSSSRENDQRAITIECVSDKTSPYAFNDAVYNKLIELCTDICKRHGKKKLLWIEDKEAALHYNPAPDEMLLTVHRWFANKSCIPVDSEVLTRNGWAKLSEINIGDKIACADLDNLRITFEEVYDKIPEREQDTYTNNGFTATKDHRCVYSTHNSGIYRINDYKHLLAEGNLIYIPSAGKSHFEGLPLTDDELKLLIATQADGHYMHDSWGGRDRYIGLEFHFKKERKIQRIKEILDSCHYEFTESKKANGSVSIRVWRPKIVEYCEKYLSQKRFTWEWLKLSPEQAKLFLSEILLWDGCITSANKNMI